MSIGIVGLGYVGLPLAVAFAEAGEQVIGVDVDHARVAALSERQLADRGHPGRAAPGRARLVPLHDPRGRAARGRGDPRVRPDAADPQPRARPRAAAGRRARSPDVVKRDQVIVLESTTFPGTTREHLVPLLEESGLRAGEDFALAFSPERVDPGRTDYTIRTTPKVVGGLTPRCTERAAAIYGRVCDQVVPVSTPEVAELSEAAREHLPLGQHRARQRAGGLADRMGIDIWEVIDAAATKPFGFTRFEPGPGMGGHCLPVDPFYLTWKAREYDLSTEFIELAGKVNQSQPYFCVEKIERALNDAGKPVRGSRILILGVSYKAGVGDMRESPALKIIELLRAAAATSSTTTRTCRSSRARPAQRRARRGARGHRPRRDRHRAPVGRPRPVVERAPLVLDLRGDHPPLAACRNSTGPVHVRAARAATRRGRVPLARHEPSARSPAARVAVQRSHPLGERRRRRPAGRGPPRRHGLRTARPRAPRPPAAPPPSPRARRAAGSPA